MVKFTTPVTYQQYRYKIGYKDNILMLGSCFADSIGSMLDYYRFNTYINPFGVLYNPVSIANAAERIAALKTFDDKDVIKTGELYCSLSHHTSFARNTPAAFLENANRSLYAAAEFFNKATVIVITLGTAWCYKYLETDTVVANCNKLNPALFKRELLSVSRIIENLNRIIGFLPDKQVIFTVSPIRHIKDGLHGNSISKASLHLALEEVVNGNNITYFPSYEIMTDELRDYRFYAEDLVHPSAVAVKYIFERFVENCFKPNIGALMRLAEKITLAEKHRPFNSESDGYKQFLAKTEELKKQFYGMRQKTIE